MGVPSESRSIVGHLLNISRPYSYDSYNFSLICGGVEELEESFEPDTDEVQYICETSKTTIVKGYSVSIEVDMTYQKDNEIQNYFNYLVRNLPVGSDIQGDYVRFNKNETMFGTNNQFIGVRRNASIYPTSIGGSADEPLHTNIQIGGSGDGVVGYITVSKEGAKTLYSWTEASTRVPFVSEVCGVQIAKYYDNMAVVPDSNGNIKIKGSGGVPNATIVLIKSNGTQYSITQTVNGDGSWTLEVPKSEFGAEEGLAVSFAFRQTVNGMSSVTSTPIKLIVYSTLSAPVITSPDNNSYTLSNIAHVSGTGSSGTTISVTGGSGVGDPEKTECVNGLWSIDVPLNGNQANTLSIKQSIRTTDSAAATVVINSVMQPEITSPANGATEVSLTPTITGKGIASAKIKIYLDGVEKTEGTTVTVNSDGEWTHTISTSLTASHKYNMMVTQTIDNKSTNKSSTFTTSAGS